jgi:ABC-2 type transport system permease protein
VNRRAVILLARKEWRETFNSPMPYVFLVGFFLLMGWFFVSSLFLMGQAGLDEFFGPLPLLLAFFLPAFTMRLFAEEYKSGTVETLATLPLRDAEIVLGKHLSACAFWVLMLGLSALYGAALFVLGRPDAGQLAASFLGALLLGMFYAAAGLFASTLTRSQVVAFLLGFLFCFGFFLAGKAAHFLPGGWGTWLTWFGIDAHYENFLKGVVDTRDVLYLLSGQALFLAAALAAFHRRRFS